MKLEPVLVHGLLAAQPGIRRLWVAYSGGMDSHVLLHLLAAWRPSFNYILRAVYVDHGLQAQSSEWGEHCRRICAQLAVPFSQLTAAAGAAAGESPEAAARTARYAVLQNLLQNDAAVLTAHHADDQAETVLLQLLRGTGPQGLAAMPASARLGRGWLWRPLLGVPRAVLHEYANRQGLHWIEDDSNAERAMARNYLRHEVMPLLQARWPAALATIGRSARHCASSAELQQDLAAGDWVLADGRDNSLSLERLRQLPPARRRNLLRFWLRRLDLPPARAQSLEAVERELIAAALDRNPCLRWPGCELRRYRDRIYALTPLPEHDPGRVFAWSGREPLRLPGLGVLYLHPAQGTGIATERLHDGPLTIRFRQGGERFRPAGRRHSRALKKLLQEKGLPPWERDRLPLLYIGERLAVVPGLGVAAEFATAQNRSGCVLQWQKYSVSVTL